MNINRLQDLTKKCSELEEFKNFLQKNNSPVITTKSSTNNIFEKNLGEAASQCIIPEIIKITISAIIKTQTEIKTEANC